MANYPKCPFRRHHLKILLVIGLLLIAGAVIAQSQPVYGYRAGDIWRIDVADNVARQLTFSGFNGGPVLAPDGRTIAFVATSDAFIAAWQAGAASQRGGTAPGDIRLLELASEGFHRIADQSGASGSGILRSLPVWSPDGKRLAWLQIDPGAQALNAATLQVYHLDSGSTSVLAGGVDLGLQGSDIRMPSLRWGGGGISRLLYTGAGELFIDIYNASSGEFTRHNLNLNAAGDNNIRDFEWVDHLGRSLIALQIRNFWEVMDPVTGSRARLADPPRLRNRNFSGGMELIPVAFEADGDWQQHWYAALDGWLYNTRYVSARVNRNARPALSPDGRQMAWYQHGNIRLWNPNSSDLARALTADAGWRAFPIPEPTSVVWAPTEWVTTGEVVAAEQSAPVQAEATGCELPARLQVGGSAKVSSGWASRVRRDAGIGAAEVGRIEAGTVVQVGAGPICADGYNWYLVGNARLSGWAAEGADGEYWLLPDSG